MNKLSSFCLAVSLLYCHSVETFAYQRNVSMKASAVLTAAFTSTSKAANEKISGVVKDTQGEPIIGVNISVKGSTVGVITDLDGKFTLEAPSKGTLLASFMGYVTQEIPISGKKTFIIILQEDSKKLDEVVVTGYLSQKKVNLTGSVSTIDGEELTKVMSTSTAQTLQGKLPGVQITQSSGQPGSGSTIQVRGVGSVMSNTQPMVIVDGFQGSIDNVSPGDIESVSVLKDAASAAIYGSKAANGVIIITTKRGKAGTLKIDASAEFGIQQISKLPKFLNAKDYAIKRNEEMTWNGQKPVWTGDLAPEKLGDGFDWFDYVYGNTAPIQNYYLSLMGGSEKAKYAISAGYIDQKGILDLTSYNRFNLRSNFDYTFNKYVKVGINIEAFLSNKKDGVADYSLGANVASTSPTIPLSMPDGSHGIALYSRPGEINPFGVTSLTPAYLLDENYATVSNSQAYTTRFNFFLELSLLEGLKFKSVFNQHIGWNKSSTWQPSFTVFDYENAKSVFASATSNAGSSYGNNSTWEVQELLTYNKTINSKHNLALLLGFSAEKYKNENLFGAKKDFPGNELHVLDAGTTIEKLEGNITGGATVSMFGQVNYDYLGKYLVQANIRRDGSSVFAPGNQFGNFPSVSAGWRISEEAFCKNIPVLSNLKLRVGYGKLGNANIQSFAWLSTYSLTDQYPLGNSNSVYPAYYLTQMYNKKIKWETTTTTNIGVDFGLFNNRLSGTFDWYDKRTTDMLFNATIPYSSGFVTGPVVNIGEVMNKGWELNLSWNDKIKDFSYGVSFNISQNKNEVLDMGGVAPFQRGTDMWIKEGYPINSYFYYEKEGIYSTKDEVKNSVKPAGDIRPGDWIIKNVNNDDKIDEKDKTFVGSAVPEFVYGINLNAAWKGFDLSMSFNGEGEKYTLLSNSYGGINPAWLNINQYYFDNRTIIGEDGNVSKMGKYPAMSGRWTNMPEGSAQLEKTSYFRMKNIQLGYTLPSKLTKSILLNHLRIYVNAVNPFIITPYHGFDAETTSGDGSMRYYPISKSYSIGISAKF